VLLKRARSAQKTAPSIKTKPARPAWQTHGTRVLLLWATVFAAYSNSFKAELTFDNVPIISEDPRIREATSDNLRSIFTGQYWYNKPASGLYRPLTTISYLVNYAVLGNGPRPPGYHWINLTLHELNVALVYVLGLTIFADPVLAMVLAGIWGVHPILTESVTNIVGRADLLAAFGVLAGLLCYIRSTTDDRRRIYWLLMMTTSQAIGLFSKESAAVLPAIILLYDVTPYEPRTLKNRAPGYAFLTAPFVLFSALRAASHPELLINFQENPLIHAGFLAARLTAVKVIGAFIGLFAWPGNLSADHSYNAVPIFGTGDIWENVKALLALALLAAAIVFAIRWRRRWPALFFFALFFLVALLPTSNLVILIGSIMAERFMYLPAVGLAGCVVAVAAALKWSQPRVLALTGILCLALGARTFVRNADWHDQVTLWTSAIQATPKAARPYNNLGYEMQKMGRLPEAIADYRAALRVYPDYAEAHYNLANTLLQTPRGLQEAIAEYQWSIRIAPRYAEAHVNLGNALSRIPGKFDDAIGEFQIALQIRPDYAEAHNNLGNILTQNPARLPQAVGEFQAALHISPGYAEAHNNLGNALARIQGRLPEAVLELQSAIRIKPDYAEAHNNLGNAWMQTPGHLQDATQEFQTALRINPYYAEAHSNLGSAFFSAGRFVEAIPEYEAATRIQPGLADAHYNLANALLRTGRVQQAKTELESVLRLRPDPEAWQLLNQIRGHNH